MSLMLDGKSNSEIAEELYISKFTVESHISNIGKKLEIAGKGKVREWLSYQKM